MHLPFVLTLMLFLHIIDDFCLQPIVLNKLKQKSWWEQNAPDPLYKNDYKIALLIHSFSWAFSIMLPIAIQMQFQPTRRFYAALIINALLHAWIDDAKANRHAFNLIQDQCLHIFCIIATFIIVYYEQIIF